MTRVFTKKYPKWVDVNSFITTVALHCDVEAFPVAKYKRFIFLVEYKYMVTGKVKNLNCFERYAHVCLQENTKNMSMRRKVSRGRNRKIVSRMQGKK